MDKHAYELPPDGTRVEVAANSEQEALEKAAQIAAAVSSHNITALLSPSAVRPDEELRYDVERLTGSVPVMA